MPNKLFFIFGFRCKSGVTFLRRCSCDVKGLSFLHGDSEDIISLKSGHGKNSKASRHSSSYSKFKHLSLNGERKSQLLQVN